MSDPLLTSLQELRTTAEAQQASIGRLTKAIEQQNEHLAALVAAVAVLMGEELGTPVQAEQERPTDFDGNPI